MASRKTTTHLRLTAILTWLTRLITAFILFCFAQITTVHAATQKDVKRGRYLALASDCISCHTTEGGKPYAGGLAMETPFGTLYAPNITPEKKTGIGDWTVEEFRRAVRDGVGKHNEFLYPVMPFDFYTKMSERDVDAMYAYLMTIKPVNQPNKENAMRFPFNIRATLFGWRVLFFKAGEFQPNPAKGKQWNRGAYLVEGPGHCADCHSPRNILGGIKRDELFTGGEVDNWAAVNITSDLKQGIGAFNVDELAAFLKTGSVKGKTTVFGPMTAVVKNSLSKLSDSDVRAIAVYLKDLPPETVKAPDLSAVSVTNKKTGEKLYNSHCAMCHRNDGIGWPGSFPPLKGNGAVVADDPADVLMVVLKGIPLQNDYSPMPSFAEHLNDQQIADLVNYVRTSWGNNAPANVSAEMVATWRNKAFP